MRSLTRSLCRSVSLAQCGDETEASSSYLPSVVLPRSLSLVYRQVLDTKAVSLESLLGPNWMEVPPPARLPIQTARERETKKETDKKLTRHVD